MDCDAIKIAKMIDHSILKPEATLADLENGCATAMKHKTATVCVRPCDVSSAKGFLQGSDTAVAVVVGFPHGANSTCVKAYETECAIRDGATEIDMVMNYGRLISGEYDYVEDEIRAVTNIAHKHKAIVKVIFETCALNESLIIEACKICNVASVDFVKTSTGFGAHGARPEDVILMKKYCNPAIRIKASGGIKTFDAVIEMMRLGVTRIGTSSTEAIMQEAKDKYENRT